MVSQHSNDGGTAFPIINVHQPWNTDQKEYDGVETTIESYGLSRRDWFAAHASDKDTLRWMEIMAENGQPATWEEAKYLYADAMIKASEK